MRIDFASWISRELKECRDGAPVARARGDQVEVGRAPVLDKRRLRVPAPPSVELLQISLAAVAAEDQVTLVPVLGLEPHEVAAPLVTAVRAAGACEGPAAAAEVAGQAALAVFEHVGEARGAAAERTDPDLPHVLVEVLGALGEVMVEGRPGTPEG